MWRRMHPGRPPIHWMPVSVRPVTAHRGIVETVVPSPRCRRFVPPGRPDRRGATSGARSCSSWRATASTSRSTTRVSQADGARSLAAEVEPLGGTRLRRRRRPRRRAACRGLVPEVVAQAGRPRRGGPCFRVAFRLRRCGELQYAAMDAHWRPTRRPSLAQALHAHAAETGRRWLRAVNLLDQKLWNRTRLPVPHAVRPPLRSRHDAAFALASRRHRLCASPGVAPGVTLLSGAMSEAEFVRASR